MSNVTGNVTWIRLNIDIFDVGKLPVIASMQDGATLELLWVKLLVLAGQSNSDGYLYIANSIPFDKKTLANRCKVKEKTMENALKIFKNFGMIDEDRGVFLIKNWAKYQNVDGMEKVREQTRIRVSAYRERHKTADCNVTCNVTDNVTETLCNAPHKKRRDIEENKSIKENLTKENDDVDDLSFMTKKEKKPQQRVNLNAALDEQGIDGELRTAMNDFIAMRKAKKKPLTERALKMVLNELNKLSTDPSTQVLIVEQSVLHNWDTVYALKSDQWKPINSVGDVAKIPHRNPFAEMAREGQT